MDVKNITYHMSHKTSHVISYHIVSYRIISYHIISSVYHIISYIISYHISYHLISSHIISYQIKHNQLSWCNKYVQWKASLLSLHLTDGRAVYGQINRLHVQVKCTTVSSLKILLFQIIAAYQWRLACFFKSTIPFHPPPPPPPPAQFPACFFDLLLTMHFWHLIQV